MSILPTVYIVDDDPAILKALTRLLQAEGLAAKTFDAPEDFLAAHDPAAPGCLVLDLQLPGIGGLALQSALQASDHERYVIFITGHGEVSDSVKAMKAGAVDFLTKPFDDEDFLSAIRSAIAKDERARNARQQIESIRQRLATLTPREDQVLMHVVAGRRNKQIAFDLGTAEKTIKVHRARAMEKMGTRSLAALVRTTVEAGMRAENTQLNDSFSLVWSFHDVLPGALDERIRGVSDLGSRSAAAD
jgi:FixJ family two-component response regulator